MTIRRTAAPVLAAFMLGTGGLALPACGNGGNDMEEAMEEAEDEAQDAKEELEDEIDDRG